MIKTNTDMTIWDLDERTWQDPSSNDFEGYYRLKDTDVDVKIKVRLHLSDIDKQSYGDVKLWSPKNMNWAPVFTWNAPEIRARFVPKRIDGSRNWTARPGTTTWWHEDVEEMLRYSKLVLHTLVPKTEDDPQEHGRTRNQERTVLSR